MLSVKNFLDDTGQDHEDGDKLMNLIIDILYARTLDVYHF